MAEHRTGVLVAGALIGTSAVLASYAIGSSVHRWPVLLGGVCVAVVVAMWLAAWRLRANREASVALLGFSAIVAGLLVLLAVEFARMRIGAP